MVVSDYLKADFCVMNLSSNSKDDAVKEIAQKLESSGKLIDKNKFVVDVLAREALGSTGIGNNVGIPHARTDAVKGFVMGFGKSSPGIEFNSLDGAKVNLVFLMGADLNELNLYLRILAELSKLLMNSAFRQELIIAKTAAEVVAIVKKYEKG